MFSCFLAAHILFTTVVPRFSRFSLSTVDLSLHPQRTRAIPALSIDEKGRNLEHVLTNLVSIRLISESYQGYREPTLLDQGRKENAIHSTFDFF